MESRHVLNDVLLPKYYDPWIDEARRHYKSRSNLTTIGELVEAGFLNLSTGDEIGRLSYGTGNIPFIRTSDFGSWELKREAKQGISEEIYQYWEKFQNVQAKDILLVRDGTYLVGTSILVQKEDLPLLYCGGIYKLWCINEELLPPGLLFALLNTPFVRRQIKNKQFTRDVIDTLGQRVLELVLPIPKDPVIKRKVSNFFDSSLSERTRLRADLHYLTSRLFTSSSIVSSS